MRSLLAGSAAAAAIALAALAAGCSDPGVAITIAYDNPELRGQLASLTVAVVQLEPRDGAAVTCDDVKYGRVDRQQLDGGRRASASALSPGASINGVPRLDDKLFVLEGLDPKGVRVAGGCTGIGDIESDTTVAITAEVVARVRLIGRDAPLDPSATPTDFLVALQQPWLGTDGKVVGMGGRELRVDARDRTRDQLTYATATTCAEPVATCRTVPPVVGLATIPIANSRMDPAKGLEPGPVEMVVHAPWVEEPLVVRAFEPLAPLGEPQPLAPPAMPRAANHADPSWVVVPGAGLGVAALHVTGGATPVYRIVLFDNVTGALTLRRREIVVDEPIHSLVVWDGAIWTVAASGWRRVDFAAATLAPGIGGPAVAATELVAIEACGTVAGPRGLLVRTADDTPYVAYDAPSVLHTSGAAFTGLTADINGISPGKIMATLCLSHVQGVRRTVVVRGEIGGGPATTYLITGATRLTSPIASGFYTDDDGQILRLVGAVLDVTGPRLASYTLTAGAALVDDDGRLDGDLTTLPTSTAIATVDGLRIVATGHAIVDDSRIQVTYLPSDGRAPLTGLSPPFRGVAPVVVMQTVDRPGGGTLQLVGVATSEVLALFSFTPLAGAR